MIDATDFPTVIALQFACDRQVAVAAAAIALLGLMDRAGDFGAEGDFDASRRSVAETMHDVIRVDCEALGEIASEAGFAIGAELRALSRQLCVDWVGRYEAARMGRAVALAAE